MRMCLVAIALWTATAAAMAAEDVVFSTSVKLVLDGSGAPGTVEPDPRLPAPVQASLVKQLAGWRFEAVDGQSLPSESITYATLGICLLPSRQSVGDIDMVVDYRGLGPQLRAGSQEFPRYPPDAARAGYSADMDVSYLVQPDGTVTLQEVAFVEGNGNAQRRRVFEQAIREWMAKMRYEPEQREGQTVATAIRSQVRFWVGPDRSQRAKRMQAKIARLDTCAAAAVTARDGGAVVLYPWIRRVKPDS